MTTPTEVSTEDFDAEIAKAVRVIAQLAAGTPGINDSNIEAHYKAARLLFRALLRRAGHTEKAVTALLTKYNDAGPRSAPWKPVSSRVPGRPQDGKDGNRIKRWELPEDHKFYSSRIDGTLVAIKYIFQTLSMTGAPATPAEVSDAVAWLVGHPVRPGSFRDPIQQIEVSLAEVIENPRLITSGHIVPLDRGGRHLPENTSLLLKGSNDLQGNNTVEELLDLLYRILERHGRL